MLLIQINLQKDILFIFISDLLGTKHVLSFRNFYSSVVRYSLFSLSSVLSNLEINDSIIDL